MLNRWWGGFVVVGLLVGGAAGNERLSEQGNVRFAASAEEKGVPERFRLGEGEFAWQSKRMETVTETLEVWEVTFPSQVKSAEEVNNTVHCEYYRSLAAGARPGVIVLHILGGDFALSRVFANTLAQNGVNALFLKMPYYGPRRDPASKRRMVSPDPRETVEGMTQAVLDIRRGVAWLAARPEVEATNIGIFGISLGGITAALATEMEPRIKSACLLLAGGDIGQASWDAAELAPIRERWVALGRTREEYFEVLRPVDPVTHAAAARGKRILMLNAASDEVVPRGCTESLWKALGEPEIQWYSGGHYSVMRHLFDVLLRVPRFFARP